MKLHTKHRPVYLFGTDAVCACSVQRIKAVSETSMCMDLHIGSSMYPGISVAHLLGEYNAINCAAASLAALVLGVPSARIAQSLSRFAGVPGRLECYTLPSDKRVYIDYAHNPSSFAAVLSTLRGTTDDLRVVFGCGGLRDREKRPVMGYVASMYADVVYITTDNPRTEDARVIAQEVLAGVPDDSRHRVHIILDRAEAIRHACHEVRPGGVVALLGKGPDQYMIIGSEKQYFSERDIVRSLTAAQTV